MKQTALFLLFLFILALAACRPISRGPSPYQPPSPLAFVSPLYARGAAPAIDIPGGLVAPNDYRAGTITTSAASHALHSLCTHRSAPKRVSLPQQRLWRQDLMRLMIEDRVQQRKSSKCNELVVKVAQARADDMVKREYFSHINPEGRGANFFLAQVGCLPAWYPQDGNTVESITLNYHTPQASWNALVSSQGPSAACARDASVFRCASARWRGVG
jgi:hypothetical protein